MKTPYQNIYTVLKINRFIVFTVVICGALCNIFSLWTAFSTNEKALNSAFAVNTDGSIIPLKLVTQKENFMVEALAHLSLFHQYFYNIDTSNYEKNLEKALWLGNSSVDDLYRQNIQMQLVIYQVSMFALWYKLRYYHVSVCSST